MRNPGRGLSPQEAALWARLAETVKPLRKRSAAVLKATEAADAAPLVPARMALEKAQRPSAPQTPPPRPTDLHRPPDHRTLDASWDRKLTRGVVSPDFTLDLHGCTLEQAHARLDHGLTLALSQGARLVLLITGRPRPADGEAGRGERRGAIRAKVLDWLAAGSHASRIAAVRPAQPRHGGHGALYLVLRRTR